MCFFLRKLPGMVDPMVDSSGWGAMDMDIPLPAPLDGIKDKGLTDSDMILGMAIVDEGRPPLGNNLS
ncbi:hypothetical protein M5689_011944 [Euphorbia peplus]|nr:hypothetical protein M5689_011944 [Euphorbia peplus]